MFFTAENTEKVRRKIHEHNQKTSSNDWRLDCELAKQDIADYQCVLAEVEKAFELVCKEFNLDENEWLKKAEHELCGVKNNDVR